MYQPWFAKINKWVLLGLALALFVTGGVLIYLSVMKIVENNTWLLVIMVIVFFGFTVCMNAFISKVVIYRPKKINYPEAYYEEASFDVIRQRLLDAGFTETNRKFGAGFIKILNRTVYKVVLVLDESKYFNQEEEEQKPTKGIEKCTKFVGFEMFFNDSEEVKQKIVNFSFSGDNVLYEGFYVDNTKHCIVEANVINPNEHLDEKIKMKVFLGLEPIKEETQEEK